MNEVDVRKYAELMEELGLTGLEITEGDKKVRLERTEPAVTEVVAMPGALAAGLSAGAVAGSAAAPAAGAGASAAAPADSGLVSVTSPMLGVFYAAPAENAEPFVSLGDKVKKGQVLCIVEAMKLMNEITCEYEGTIAEVCVTNGQVVEYGTELFKISR